MKKFLSMLLAVLMISSMLSVGVTAYAAPQHTMEEAYARYDRVDSFDHVDIRVAGTITVNGETKNLTVSHPRVEVYNGDGTLNTSKEFTNSTSYEWRITRLHVPKDAKVVLTCDITIDGVTQADQSFTFQGRDVFARAIYDCDGFQGLDFIVREEQVEEVFYYQVNYQWTGLPDGLASLPVDANSYMPDTEVIVDTSFKQGDKLFDAEGNEYTFSGWNEYQPVGGSVAALGGTSFVITADTVVYGNWVKRVPPTTNPGSITVSKSFAGLPEDLRPASISFTITGPNDFSQTLTLPTAEGNWEATVGNLSEGTYTVSEGTAALDGYYYNCNFQGGSTTVTLTKGELDEESNSYTVSSGVAAFTNTYTKLGSLKLAKDFGTDSELDESSENIGSFTFVVTGPNGFDQTVTLPTAEGAWETVIEGLAAGAYTVSEDAASAERASYNLTINGAEASDDDVTVSVVDAAETAAVVTNTYTKKMGEDINNPASFKIVKTDEDGNKLPGAEFTLYDENNAVVKTVVTDENGEAVFSGFMKAAEYTLKETKAPENYAVSEQTWKVTVKLKEGSPTIKISSDGNFWQNIFDWIINTDPDGVDGVLTVVNKLKTGSITVSKTVENNMKLGPEAEEYNFTLTLNGEEKSFTLKDGQSKTFENVPYGTSYTVAEDGGENVSWNVTVPENAEGLVYQENINVNFVNRYEYTEEAEMAAFSGIKQSSKDNSVLEGAEFTVYSDKDCTEAVGTVVSDAAGKIEIGFKSEGIFYLKETKAPAGYVLSDKVIELSVAIEEYQVRNIENEDGSETVTIVPVLGIKVKGAEQASDSNDAYQLLNDPETYIDITVKKVWANDKDNGKRPDTITVTLYKDGEKYDSKTIGEKDKWTCTWKDLPSQYEWTVDENVLPAGYFKSVVRNGNTFTITNTYNPNPKTGDLNMPVLWALLVMATASGAVFTVKKLRRENG